jgi:hypothetical protein
LITVLPVNATLSQIPQALGLGPILKKGWFCDFFNVPDNQDYVGPMPDLQFYDPDSISSTERLEFITWYTEQIDAGYNFNFQTELIGYSRNDVDILRRGCNKFRDLLLVIGKICPFQECIVQECANCASAIFRQNFLKDNTIGVLPIRGYRMRTNQSKVGLQWLIAEERERGQRITHAGNGQEYRLPSVHLVDGFTPPQNANEAGMVLCFLAAYFTDVSLAIQMEVNFL